MICKLFSRIDKKALKYLYAFAKVMSREISQNAHLICWKHFLPQNPKQCIVLMVLIKVSVKNNSNDMMGINYMDRGSLSMTSAR